jgi:cyclophilin family peptidyl-prolyl cis-trans isomerase
MKKYLAVLLLGLFAAYYTHAGTLVEFQLYFGVFEPLGPVDVELYDQDKPVTVNNFLRLVQAGDYGDGFFHRLVPGFVLQGGGYYSANPFLTNIMAPPYANIDMVTNFGNITNEIGVGKFYSNTNGTIAMAKTSDPNSANSQFFFNLADNSVSLDSTNNSGGFTVFGRAVRGLDLLDEFNGLYAGNGIVDLTQTYGTSGASSLFTQLPISITGTSPPPYDDLVYFTVSVLQAQISIATNGVRQITWNSISGVTNNVEYTTALTNSSWQVLASTNGTGNSITVPDSASDKTRFYRIHVLFP